MLNNINWYNGDYKMYYFGFKNVRSIIMFSSGRVDNYKTYINSKIVQKLTKGFCGQVWDAS